MDCEVVAGRRIELLLQACGSIHPQRRTGTRATIQREMNAWIEAHQRRRQACIVLVQRPKQLQRWHASVAAQQAVFDDIETEALAADDPGGPCEHAQVTDYTAAQVPAVEYVADQCVVQVDPEG